MVDGVWKCGARHAREFGSMKGSTLNLERSELTCDRVASCDYRGLH